MPCTKLKQCAPAKVTGSVNVNLTSGRDEKCACHKLPTGIINTCMYITCSHINFNIYIVAFMLVSGYNMYVACLSKRSSFSEGLSQLS